MKHLDGLIIKAKKICGVTDLRLSLGMIYPASDGKWEAYGQLWGYIPGYKPGARLGYVKRICDSVDDGMEILEQLSNEYPNEKDVAVIVDTLEGD